MSREAPVTTQSPQPQSQQICRVCDSARLEPVIDLGMQPWCNHFLRAEEVGTEPIYPLRVAYCLDCETAQLDHTVPKEVMFGNHTYLSGVTRSLSDHFRSVAEEVAQRFTAGKSRPSVLDIGSNDGTQLKHFQTLGFNVLGIESSRTTAEIANAAGVNTVNEFFNADLVLRIGRRFDVINAAGVFFHLEELHSVTEGIRIALADDGVFVVQFLYMPSIIDNLAFDQIYHEHLLYYTLTTVNQLLARHGLELFDAYLSPIHGGSIVGFATHAGRLPKTSRLEHALASEIRGEYNSIDTYRRFAERIQTMRVENLAFLEDRATQGKRVYGMGAPVKGNTLLNYFGVTNRLMQCVVERNTLRRGLYTPGSHLPVLMEDELPEPPDVYYVLAWNFKREILARNRDLIDRGVEFFFPVNPPEGN
jgi:SAM-dependent methyltransferase